MNKVQYLGLAGLLAAASYGVTGFVRDYYNKHTLPSISAPTAVIREVGSIDSQDETENREFRKIAPLDYRESRHDSSVKRIDIEQLKAAYPQIELDANREYIIYQADLNKDGYDEILMSFQTKYNQDNSDNIDGIVVYGNNSGRLSLIYRDENQHLLSSPKEISFIRNIDKDQGLEVFLSDLSCGSGGCSGPTKILKFSNDGYKLIDTIEAPSFLRNIDNDDYPELLTGVYAPGQEELANADHKDWFMAYKWNGTEYEEVPDLRILVDGSFTDASNPNPYNVPPDPYGFEQRREESQQMPLESRIQESLPSYDSRSYSQNYDQLEEDYLRLRIVLEKKFKENGHHENPLVSRIYNAESKLITRILGESYRILPDRIYQDNRGVIDIYENIPHPKSKEVQLEIEIIAPPYEPYRTYMTMNDLENARAYSKLAGFDVIKGKDEHPSHCEKVALACNYEEVVLLLEMEILGNYPDYQIRLKDN